MLASPSYFRVGGFTKRVDVSGCVKCTGEGGPHNVGPNLATTLYPRPLVLGMPLP